MSSPSQSSSFDLSFASEDIEEPPMRRPISLIKLQDPEATQEIQDLEETQDPEATQDSIETQIDCNQDEFVYDEVDLSKYSIKSKPASRPKKQQPIVQVSMSAFQFPKRPPIVLSSSSSLSLSSSSLSSKTSSRHIEVIDLTQPKGNVFALQTQPQTQVSFSSSFSSSSSLSSSSSSTNTNKFIKNKHQIHNNSKPIKKHTSLKSDKKKLCKSTSFDDDL